MEQVEQSAGIEAQTRRPRCGFLVNHVCIPEIAEENGLSERGVRNEMDRLAVPYIKFANVRWYDRDKVRAALLATAVDKSPRGRGRPRKTA